MPRFLVIGGGVAGIATAWSLAERGETDVVVLEREELLGTHSSGRNAAILRTLCADPVTTRFGLRGAAFLHAPPRGFTDTPLVERCGLLLTADEGGADELLRWFEAAGPRSGGRRISASRARELAPHVTSDPSVALWYPDEGRIDVAALMAGFERGARRRGVELRTGEAVERLVVRDGTVVGAELSSGELVEAETTVLAAGGWAGLLGATAGSRIELEPRRRHLLVTAPVPSLDPQAPVLWHHGARPFYGRPESGGMLACACDEAVVHPDRLATDASVREDALRRLGEHVESLEDVGALRLWAGLRTFSADGEFAIGPDPDLTGLFWVAGLGGHGMVASAPTGALAAARLLREAPEDPAAARAFDPARLVPQAASAPGLADSASAV